MQLETSPELSQMATPITQLYSAVSNMHIQVLLLDMCSKNIPIEVGKNKQHLHEKGVPIFFFLRIVIYLSFPCIIAVHPVLPHPERHAHY